MKEQRGVLLIEILLAVAFFASIGVFATQSILVSMRSNTEAAYRDASMRLAREEIEVARAAASINWYTLYHAPFETEVYPTSTASGWSMASGTEVVMLGDVPYTRSLQVASTSRDFTTRDIMDVYDPAQHDPSTLKVTASVVTHHGATTTLTEYIHRWRNIVCDHNSWNTGTVSPAPSPCGSGGGFIFATTTPSGSFDVSDDTLELSPLAP